MPTGRLQDKVCVITGAASGQGASAAGLFAREGARVVASDINDEAGNSVVQAITSGGGEAVYIHSDATAEPDVQALVQAAVDRYGRLDVMYNNAGLIRMGPLAELSTGDWYWDLDHEVTLVFYGIKYAIRQMLAQAPRGGVIINTASDSGLVGIPTHGPHCATKAAVIGLTRSVAVDYGRQGIRCNAIAPGFIATEGQTRELAADEQFLSFVRQMQVIDDVGRPEDIASCALWLASEESRFVHGQVIPVDGGWTAR